MRIAAWIVTAIALVAVLALHLLGALLAGLLVFQLVHSLAPPLQRRFSGKGARLLAVALLATAIVGLLTLAVFGVIAFFRSDAGSVHVLLDKVMEIVDEARAQLPAVVGAYLPDDIEEARKALSEWLHTHGDQLQLAGRHAVEALVRLLIGMVLGALIALNEVLPEHNVGPFGVELQKRCSNLADAFRRIVFAQIRISGLNTLFTGIFLLVVLPLAGTPLPLAKTLIAITFVVGLLPVIGNLVSNTLITVIALSVSVYVAIAALVFLVVIHKLEYFLNARIVGTQIRSRAWELLMSMVVLESAFGLPGLVAAPIYYAYVKRELVDQGWV